MENKFEKVFMVKALKFQKIIPFWQKVNFRKRKTNFRKLSHISNLPIAKFHMKCRKWNDKKMNAYINVEFDV